MKYPGCATARRAHAYRSRSHGSTKTIFENMMLNENDIMKEGKKYEPSWTTHERLDIRRLGPSAYQLGSLDRCPGLEPRVSLWKRRNWMGGDYINTPPCKKI
ncbi:hypothetical protein EVAR_5811_1 [Eumeta japonica]|uniref:Uncharacterized protein n=1 Tax=Eumeta variegata TaxID=151549 RepID=A0A4C1T7H3_EUMVA|nr:hypothetical protein EVAR_5811_1 [Eumeta japonica]